DGASALEYAGQAVPSSAREVVFKLSDGTDKTIRFTDISTSAIALLWGCALLFVLVAGAVYRWSADAGLRNIFLTLAVSFATALAIVPVSLLGYGVATFIAGAGALTAGSSLLVLFLRFPRRVRHARVLSLGSFAGSLVLMLAQVAEYALPAAPRGV